MPDPESVPNSPNGDLHMGSPSSPPVPQITLTRANDTHSRPSTSTQLPTPSPHSAQSLSPTLGRPSTTASNSPPPLPLTRDLLQRKNKLDALLRDGNRQTQPRQYPTQTPIMTFGTDSNIMVDERVTAGLGISTPTPTSAGLGISTPTPTPTPAGLGISTPQQQQQQEMPSRHTTSNVRHRRHSTRPSISTNMATIMDHERRSGNRKTPPASPHITNEFYSWIHDIDLKAPPGHSTSIKDHIMMFSGYSSRATSRSASSIHHSIFDEKKDMYYADTTTPSISPPPYSQYHSSPIHHVPDLIRPHYGHQLLSYFFEAAKRVVNLRGPEEMDDLLQTNTISPPSSSYRRTPRHHREDHDHYHHPEPSLQKRISNGTSFDKRSVFSSPALSLADAAAPSSLAGPGVVGSGQLDKRSLYSDYPSTAKQESRHAAMSLKEIIPPPPPSSSSSSSPPSGPLGGNSLCMFTPNNRIRRYLWHNVIQSCYVEAFLFIIIMLHYFLLICDPIYENQQKTIFGAQWTHYAILGIQVIYTLEAICKIIVYGIWLPPTISTSKCFWFRRWLISLVSKNGNEASNLSEEEAQQTTTKERPLTHRPYISGFANTLDIISIISYWVDFGLMIHGYPYCSLFKAIGASRPLRLAMIFKGTATILRSLLVSWDMLKDVLGFIFFFLVLFALIGLITFKGVFSRRCYAMGADGQYTLVEPPLHCSGYYSGTTVLGAYNPDTDSHSYAGLGGYICRNDQICMENQDNNPDFGFVNFDTIYFALLAVFSSMSLELWTELMSQNMDADSNAAALFYCLVAYVLSFILIFMIFAVITSGFSRVRAAHRVSAFTGKKKSYRVLHSVQGEEEEFMWRFEDPTAFDQGRTRRIKQLLISLVKSRAFFYFGVLLVSLDIGFMCARSAHASEYVLEMIDNAETAFTFLFALEIFIRIIGAPSWTQFWYSGRNKFDLFLVIVTCVIQLPMIQDSESYKYLTIFQCLRAYRLFIGIPRVRHLLSAALGNGEGVIYVVIFLLLLTALFAPIFMQLFGGDFGFIDEDETQLRCDTFWQSYLTLIMIYTSEMWTSFLYNAMESQPNFSAVYAAIITCGYFAFARYVMAGLYIAVILENFELEDEFIKQYQIRQFIQRRTHTGVHRFQSIINKVFGSMYLKSKKKQVNVRRLPAGLTASMDKNALTDLLVGQPSAAESGNEKAKAVAANQDRPKDLFDKIFRRRQKQEESSQAKRSNMPSPLDPFAQDVPDDDYELIVEEENRQATAAEIPTSKSLFIFSSNNKVRRFCKMLAGSSANGRAERKNLFNWFIMACVLASILLVILDEPSTRLMRQDTIRQSAYRVADMTLSIIFVIEIIVRIIADGFILPPDAYLRNAWNRLDFIVVILNLAALFAGDGDLSRALGTVRSLRVLRLIRYFSGMRDVFVDLFHAFPLMLDALLLVFLVMIFFSVYGVNMLGGRMTACNDDEVEGRSTCIGEFINNVGGDDDATINILQPRVWAIPEGGMYSYDDFPIALAHLFSLSSTEGWIDSLFYAMSAPPEPDIQPSFDWNGPSVYHSIFYVVFMVVSHGTLQLFVGVIIEKFKQRAGITTMTTGQRQYADLLRQLAEIKPTPKAQAPNNRIGHWCHSLVVSKRGLFNKFMMSVVILNICVICTEFQNQPEWLTTTQDYCYLVFIILYIFEVIAKFIGLGWKKWSKGKWNWYCAFIAVSAFVLTILRFALPDLWTLRLERYCLVLAAFRLGEGIDALQTLYHTIRMSLPKIIRVTAVFLLVLCLFAMIFMELFGLTKYGLETNGHSNFRDYGNALLLLIRVATGEAWNIVMMDSTVQAPNCVASDDYLLTDCGSPAWAFFLYNTFYLVCTHIFLNLFTAAVLSNFEYAYETRSRFTLLSKDDLRSFKSAWSEVDPSGSGYIQREDVVKFLSLLRGRFHMRIYDDRHSIGNLQKLSQQGIPDSFIINEKPSGFSSTTNVGLPIPYNVDIVNKSLSKIDSAALRRRRRLFNLCYLEIIGAESARGISFEDVRTIMSYRFVDIEEALPIDALIVRLEKQDQVSKAYAAERARGVFLTLLQRKRYLHALWQKKNEEEMLKLGISTKSPLQLDTSAAGLSPKSPRMANQWKNRSPVPTIVIEDAPPSPRLVSDYASPASLTIPLSPMSNYSFETQYGSPIGQGGGADSLNVAIGTTSPQYSPFPSTDQEENISLPGALSPNSPYSPTTLRQNWRVIDGNASMSSELAESLMDSLERNAWADMLHDNH